MRVNPGATNSTNAERIHLYHLSLAWLVTGNANNIYIYIYHLLKGAITP